MRRDASFLASQYFGYVFPYTRPLYCDAEPSLACISTFFYYSLQHCYCRASYCFVFRRFFFHAIYFWLRISIYAPRTSRGRAQAYLHLGVFLLFRCNIVVAEIRSLCFSTFFHAIYTLTYFNAEHRITCVSVFFCDEIIKYTFLYILNIYI